MANEEITIIFEFEVQPGRADDFDALLPLLEEVASHEPGTVEYRCYRGPTPTAMCFYERYRDSDAAIGHIEAFGQGLGKRYVEMITPKSVIMLGPASAQLAAQLAPFFDGSIPGVSGTEYLPVSGSSNS